MSDSSETYTTLRQTMVETQLIPRGISAPEVIHALRTIPRELFIPQHLRPQAYNDTPAVIGHKQTISQPYMVALMTELADLRSNDTVLEIGTGSGYQAAILSQLCKKVYTIERNKDLADTAHNTLNSLGFQNIHIHIGDGTLGLNEYAPYNAIIVTAGGPKIPQALKQQLAIGGRMVCPVGDRKSQDLLVITRHKTVFETLKHSQCRFLPLIGQEGWTE